MKDSSLKAAPKLKQLKLLGLIFCLLCTLMSDSSISQAADSKGVRHFEADPYLQLGKADNGSSVTLMWLSKDPNKTGLSCSYKVSTSKDWKPVKQIESRPVNGHPELSILACSLTELPPGKKINYMICKDNKVIFESTFLSAPAPGSPFHFVVFGDCGKGSDGEAAIAAQLKQTDASLAVLPGDIVYPIGTIHFYKRHFFPYFNAEGNEEHGSALMRSKIFVACPGNHDVAEGGYIDARDLNTTPDSMSYFVLFDQPLNGPIAQAGVNTPNVIGSKKQIDDFLKAAGPRYPRMANFSFNYGDAHFVILDGNRYMDWDDTGLRRWLENDLKQSKSTWKFAVFHQPGFNSDLAHREEQRMRKLSDIFERTGVDLCFSGHSHSYQRSMPLHFSANTSAKISDEARSGFVSGNFHLDKAFDGIQKSKPDGVIYLVSGGGGAPLTHHQLEDDKSLWLPFTKKFSCRRFSFTSCRISGRKLSIEQIGDDGVVIDRFVVSKD